MQVYDQIEQLLYVPDIGTPQLWYAASKGGIMVKATLAKGALFHRGRKVTKLRSSGILYTVEAAVFASAIRRWVRTRRPMKPQSPWWSSEAKCAARGFDVIHYKPAIDDMAICDIGVQQASFVSLVVDCSPAGCANFDVPVVTSTAAAVDLSITVLVRMSTQCCRRSAKADKVQAHPLVISSGATVLQLKTQPLRNWWDGHLQTASPLLSMLAWRSVRHLS